MQLVSTFEERSRKIALSFLQTVVVVDDRPFYPSVAVLQEPSIINEPPSLSDAISGGVSGPLKTDSNLDDSPTLKSVEIEHDINAKSLIDVFADLGLVCGLLCPRKGDIDVVQKAANIAHRADIVILDWYLLGSKSATALEILANIIEADDSRRLRLISIYTGQPQLDEVCEAVAKRLKETIEKTNRSYAISKLDTFTIQAGPIMVSVFAKPNSSIPKENKAFSARIVSESELPERLIAEFTKMTAGLVSNVALQSLCVLRERTHELLGRLHQRLDAPFLSHKALLPHPEDANNHLIAMVVSEITELLVSAKAGDASGKVATSEWVRAKSDREWSITVPGTNSILPILTGVQVEEILVDGIEKFKMLNDFCLTCEPNITKKQVYKNLTNLFCSDNEASSLDFEFARITSMAASRSKDGVNGLQLPPVLSLGIVLERLSKDNKVTYWLCVQPLCDSNRINDKRGFPLIRLRKVDSKDAFRIVVVNQNGSDVRLTPILKAYELENIQFVVSNGHHTVNAHLKDKEYQFLSDSKEVYFWLGTLKQEQAQRIANEFASQMCRVGLDESEWLRRSARVE